MTDERVRIGVIGAGRMGRNHLRILSRLDSVDLIGLIEPDSANASEAVQKFQCQVFTSIDALCDQVDAVIVTAPSAMHGAIGLQVLKNKTHCLMEKPLAVTEQECLSLISTAEENGVILMVGHVERFNPAIQQLKSILDDGQRVFAYDARRMSATSSRISVVDGVMDLMVHDIDVISWLAGEKVKQISSVGTKEGSRDHFDYVVANLTFESGSIASITASRITQNKIRSLQVTSEKGLFEADFVNQSVDLYQQNSMREMPEGTSGSFLLDLTVGRVLINRAEPLMSEISHFVDCIRNNTPPLIDGKEAYAALKIAWAIQESLELTSENQGTIIHHECN